MIASVTTKPGLIVQNRNITLRSAPFHRQKVFIRIRNKSHSTDLIRCCRMHEVHMWYIANCGCCKDNIVMSYTTCCTRLYMPV